MSLRPHFSGFSLAELTSLFGNQSGRDLSEMIRLFDSLVEMTNVDEQARAQTTITRIISGVYTPHSLAEEDETFQNAMIAMAQYRQQHLVSESIFWESFLNIAEHMLDDLGAEERQLLSYFFTGRPLIGQSIRSSWTFYAYLKSDEADEFAQFIERNRHIFEREYDFQAAWAWLEQVRRQRMDIWFYAY